MTQVGAQLHEDHRRGRWHRTKRLERLGQLRTRLCRAGAADRVSHRSRLEPAARACDLGSARGVAVHRTRLAHAWEGENDLDEPFVPGMPLPPVGELEGVAQVTDAFAGVARWWPASGVDLSLSLGRLAAQRRRPPRHGCRRERRSRGDRVSPDAMTDRDAANRWMATRCGLVQAPYRWSVTASRHPITATRGRPGEPGEGSC
jgi:hypothetical protein